MCRSPRGITRIDVIAEVRDGEHEHQCPPPARRHREPHPAVEQRRTREPGPAHGRHPAFGDRSGADDGDRLRRRHHPPVGAPLPLDRRSELAAVIGTDAEAIVHAYACLDRAACHPVLADPGSPLRDRFTGAARTPGLRTRRDLAEPTAADELDLAGHDPEFRDRWGADLPALFTRFRPPLGGAAWAE
ncbi:DUF6817 domain-containing protein [Streptomyces sp. NPDC001595]|uniref:DUF6817 domain-containing protein n=1 Tax=Streptomyces sp. NPDC001532 TaxID=3154520 RepID=UPI003320A8D2